jgi:hypothetical protein
MLCRDVPRQRRAELPESLSQAFGVTERNPFIDTSHAKLRGKNQYPEFTGKPRICRVSWRTARADFTRFTCPDGFGRESGLSLKNDVRRTP